MVNLQFLTNQQTNEINLVKIEFQSCGKKKISRYVFFNSFYFCKKNNCLNFRFQITKRSNYFSSGVSIFEIEEEEAIRDDELVPESIFIV
jgi:hypothetical protein